MRNDENVSDGMVRLENGEALFSREVTSKGKNEATKSVVVVLIVHGGPGLSDHSEIFEGLRPLILRSFVDVVAFYDQLGCGNSDKPLDKRRYSIDASADELRQMVENVCERYSTPRIVVLGHSWGGQVVLQFIFRERERLVDLGVCGSIVCNAPLDENTYERRQQAMKKAMDDSLRTFLECEEAQVEGVEALVYRAIIGKGEANITGNIKGWNMLPRLQDSTQDLPCPCLFIVGEHDTVPPEEYEALSALQLVDRKAIVIPGAEHAPFYERESSRDLFFYSVCDFIESVTRTDGNNMKST